jgi:hypothetical protein
MRRHDTYGSNFSSTPVTLAGFSPTKLTPTACVAHTQNAIKAVLGNEPRDPEVFACPRPQ